MTFHLFPAQTYVDRRAALMTTLGSGIVLLMGNETSPINYRANTYRFRQDSNFLYYGGIDLPGLNLVLDCDQKKVILYGDEQTVEDEIWSGTREKLASLAKRAGIDEVRPSSALIPDYGHSEILCLPPY